MSDTKVKRAPMFSESGWPLFGGVPRDPEDCDYSDRLDRYYFRENVSLNGTDEDCDIYWQDMVESTVASGI